MKLLVLLFLTVVIKVCCNSDSGSCCRDYERLNESVTNMLIRVDDLEIQNKRLNAKSRRMEKEIQVLQNKITKPCPKGFKLRRHSCYLLVKNEQTKQNAERYCSRKACSHLVRIQSKGEIEKLTDFLEGEKDVPSRLFTIGHLENSLTLDSGSANWVWSKSDPIKLTEWNKLGDLPVRVVKDQIATCVVLVKTENDWVLQREYCKEKMAFICEKRKTRWTKLRKIKH